MCEWIYNDGHKPSWEFNTVYTHSVMLSIAMHGNAYHSVNYCYNSLHTGVKVIYNVNQQYTACVKLQNQSVKKIILKEPSKQIKRSAYLPPDLLEVT